MIESLAYCAPLVYSPKGGSEVAKKSRVVRDAIKAGDKQLIPAVANYVVSLVDAGHFKGFFGADVTLVPVPGRAPIKPGSLWVPLMIAHALKDAGLASEVWPTLSRERAVQKSAWAGPGERPTVQGHYESFRIEDRLLPTSKITLVDDFVTKGRTLFASAIKLSEVSANLDIRAFAYVRTMGLVADISAIKDPIAGEIRRYDSDVNRSP